ncbi:hypothetical protein A4X06_0g5205 [Tilletia controversa]|uniref:Uncharacterized protein n=1 Tax=Tilletia controversa TaxID=13291 RepID=A0A8X7MRC5_9BASI|nr:hypothetical protein A4X06_0g5205 [Tilletia controversa]
MNDYQIGKKEYQRAQDSRGDHEADGRERLLTDEKSATAASSTVDEGEQQHEQQHRHQLRRARLLLPLRLVLILAFILTASGLTFFLVNGSCRPSSASSSSSSASTPSFLKSFFGFYADTDNSSKSDGKLSALKHASLNKKTVVFGMGIGDITGPVVGINIMGYEDWNVARAVALFRQSIGSGDRMEARGSITPSLTTIDSSMLELWAARLVHPEDWPLSGTFFSDSHPALLHRSSLKVSCSSFFAFFASDPAPAVMVAAVWGQPGHHGIVLPLARA